VKKRISVVGIIGMTLVTGLVVTGCLSLFDLAAISDSWLENEAKLTKELS
jgi:hypothetical protein